MKGFDLYIFLICLLIFVVLTVAFAVFITIIGKQRLRLLAAGLEDDKIKSSVEKKLKSNKKRCSFGIIDKIISVVLCVFLAFACIMALTTSVRGNNVVKGMPAFKVVTSTSMSAKYEKNQYLFMYNLNDQIQLFDLVVLHELPAEKDIKLYDVIVYEHIDGTLLIHRVINIEEPNQNHPNERYFLFQGDAVAGSDLYPVKYSQMKSIYKGERVSGVGSFVFFIQSPAGILCIVLIILALIAMPIVDKKFWQVEFERVKDMVNKGELEEKALDVYEKSEKRKGDGQLK